MSEPFKYRLPVGVITNEKQLRDMQKQLLKQQYEKNIHHKQIYGNQDMQNYPQRRLSERNLLRPQAALSLQFAKNEKQDQIKRMLAFDLKHQMEQNQLKKKTLAMRKLQQEKMSNRLNRQISQRQAQTNRMIRDKIHLQMTKDYQQKIKRKQQQHLNEIRQKQTISKRLKQIQAISNPQRRIKATTNNPEATINQLPNPSKVQFQIMKLPEYYKDVADYQQQNYRKYQENVKHEAELKNRKLQHILDQRIRQNRRKEHEFQSYKQSQKQNRRQQLQRALQQQIKQSQKRKQEQLAYDKAKFYGSKFENVYNPICNPVDSKFCKDNKYIISELHMQAQKKSSRGSQANEDGTQSGLARRGSLSLL